MNREGRGSKMRQSMRRVYQHLLMIHNLVDAQAKEIAALKKMILEVKKEENVKDYRGGSIEDIDVMLTVSLVDETQRDMMIVTKPVIVSAGKHVNYASVDDLNEFRVPQETQPSSLKIKEKEVKEKKEEVEEEKESEEVEEDDEVELKKLLVIKRDEDIAIDAIPLATKLPVIIDYKLHKEGLLVHYELIRADGSSNIYSSMIRMLQGIDREDLEALWRIVKAKYGDTRPENEFERVLYGYLKVMFEPDIKSDI
ncbi:hypothetical protein Tco_0640752 [Tanacetum coccineum]